MHKVKVLTLLTISLVIWLSGCGDSTGGYGIFRSWDIITVFIPLPDTSEIAEVKVDNKALHIDIDTGEKIVLREIRLQRRLFQVIHLRAFDTKHKVSKFINLYISKFYDFKITDSREKPEPFENSGAFRVGDKIMAYCRLQDNMDSPSKTFQVNLGGVKIKRTNATVNTHIITEGEIGERLLIIEKHNLDSDKTVRNLHFLLQRSWT